MRFQSSGNLIATIKKDKKQQKLKAHQTSTERTETADVGR
jgi:hypothetical protein